MEEKAKCKNCTNEKELIEELAHSLYGRQDEYNMSNPFEIAKCVIDLGYRKITEGVIVLRVEDCSNYLMLKNDYAEVKEQNKKLQADNERLYNNLAKFKKSVQTETAKEILKELKDMFTNTNYNIDWIVNRLEDISKQFGVEVEE